MSQREEPDDPIWNGEPESWLADVLAAALPAESPAPTLRERLLLATSELPLRYAPFFDRLAGLWSLPVADVEAALTRAADRSAWRRALPGLRYFNVAESTVHGRARLLSFAPGFRFPEHRHGGEESVLVLEGHYIDSSGDVVRAGDARTLLTGTSHALTIGADAPCIAAVLQPELDFVTPLRGRLLAKFSLRRRS